MQLLRARVWLQGELAGVVGAVVVYVHMLLVDLAGVVVVCVHMCLVQLARYVALVS